MKVKSVGKGLKRGNNLSLKNRLGVARTRKYKKSGRKSKAKTVRGGIYNPLNFFKKGPSELQKKIDHKLVQTEGDIEKYDNLTSAEDKIGRSDIILSLKLSIENFIKDLNIDVNKLDNTNENMQRKKKLGELSLKFKTINMDIIDKIKVNKAYIASNRIIDKPINPSVEPNNSLGEPNNQLATE